MKEDRISTEEGFTIGSFVKLTMVLTLVLTLVMLALPVALEQKRSPSPQREDAAGFSQPPSGAERSKS